MAQVRTRAVGTTKGKEAVEADWAGARPAPTWVSVEVALYAVLLVAAGLLRLYALGRQPLGHQEAEAAWAVWQFYRGQADVGVTGAPLLFFGSGLAFLVFEASDAAARLVPAIFGIAMVAVPYFLRHWLGRWGALAASALLVISPSLGFFSRSLSPAIPALATALAFLAALLGYLEAREARYLYAAAVALALSLAAGPAIYTVLLALGLLALVVLARDRWPSLARLAPRLAIAASVGSNSEGNPKSEIRNPKSTRSLALFAAVFVLVSTGFLADYRGLQASVDLFSLWLRSFVPGGESGSLYTLQVLVSYELLALAFGVIGAVYFSWRRNPLAILLTTWLGLALLIHLVAGTREPADVTIALVPLTLLAGMAIGRLLETVGEGATLETEGFLAILALFVSVFIYFQLAGYALRAQPGFVRLAAGGTILLMALVAVFTYWSGWERALRGTGLAALLVLGALSSHASFNLNLRWTDEPAELLRPRSTSSDVRSLASLLEGISNDRQGFRYGMGITADRSLAPILPWYLRHFQQVRFADTTRDQVNTPAVIAPVEINPPLPEGYIGQRFRLETSWRFSAPSWRDRWRWYLFRLVPVEPQARDVVLYVGR